MMARRANQFKVLVDELVLARHDRHPLDNRPAICCEIAHKYASHTKVSIRVVEGDHTPHP